MFSYAEEADARNANAALERDYSAKQGRAPAGPGPGFPTKRNRRSPDRYARFRADAIVGDVNMNSPTEAARAS